MKESEGRPSLDTALRAMAEDEAQLGASAAPSGGAGGSGRAAGGSFSRDDAAVVMGNASGRPGGGDC